MISDTSANMFPLLDIGGLITTDDVNNIHDLGGPPTTDEVNNIIILEDDSPLLLMESNGQTTAITNNIVILPITIPSVSPDDNPLLSMLCERETCDVDSRHVSPCSPMSPKSIKTALFKRLEKRTMAIFSKNATKKRRCPDTEFVMPDFVDQSGFLSYNYKKDQLKAIARYHKLRISGSVNELMARVYTYLTMYAHATPLQSLYRGHLRRRCNALRGPAFLSRSKCNNDTDFLTGDLMSDIGCNQFTSYASDDGFVYGFDLVSLYNLKLNSTKPFEVQNPYNRSIIPTKVFSDMRALIRLTKKIYNVCLDIDMEAPPEPDAQLSHPNNEVRARDLFTAIDSHGHYSSMSWFMDLNRTSLIRLVREIDDIWVYRAALPLDVRMRICPTNPFHGIQIMLHAMINSTTNSPTMGGGGEEEEEEDLTIHREIALFLMMSLVTSGVTDDDRALGAIIALQALTLVSQGARESMPWFYESVAYV